MYYERRISKQAKLKQQFNSDAAPTSSKESAFFEGIHVYVNGYTEPDSLSIKNMLAAHGGVWEQYDGRCVSHIKIQIYLRPNIMHLSRSTAAM